MSSEFLRHTADVLEKMAEYLDHQETQQQETQRNEQRKVAAELNEKIAAATGEPFSAETLERLISSDPQTASLLVKLAARSERPESPDELGSPGDLRDGETARSLTKTAMTKESQQHADGRFLDWILS
jgi:hypothetical protein